MAMSETLQERFGPNVMASLDRLGLSYEEARKMIHSEMIVERMTWIKVHSKALHRVRAARYKNAYKEFCKTSPGNNAWEYRVVTVRASDEKKGLEIAERAHRLLTLGKAGMESVVQQLNQNSAATLPFVSLSQEYKVQDRDLADSHKAILTGLKTDCFSPPMPQKSRTDGSMVYRIFYLKNHIERPSHALTKSL